MDQHTNCNHAEHENKNHMEVKDPVCGMNVDPGRAKGGKIFYKGQNYFFCNRKSINY